LLRFLFKLNVKTLEILGHGFLTDQPKIL